ncbi:MAG: hypothetical protein ACYDEO_03760 [Aggregatilineales bacterium]
MSNILAALKPIDFWGYLVYLIILMDMLLIFLQKESNLFLNILMAIAILAGIINELGLNNQGSLNVGSGVFSQMLVTNKFSFANFMLDVAMFVFPLIVVGMTKTPRSRIPGILGVVLAGLFLFGHWFSLHPSL